MFISKKVKKQFQAAVILLTAMFIAALLLAGCGTSQLKPEAESEQPPAGEAAAVDDMGVDEGMGDMALQGNRITDLRINETPSAYEVIISANHMPDYTVAEPPFQQARVIYFPDSGLALRADEFQVDSDIIGTIQATELIEGGPSKIVIPVLTTEPEYKVLRLDENSIKVIFAKTEADDTLQETVEEAAVPAEAAEQEVEQEVEQEMEPFPPAPRLMRVDVAEKNGQVEVKIVANESIKVFKSFALPSPPRIVIDLEGVDSPYQREQTIEVDSEPVRQVRHFAHPDYLRLVVDVDPAYLENYDVVTISDGLLLTVGDVEEAPAYAVAEPAVETQVREKVAEKVAVDEESAARSYDQAAQVNAIDFVEESGGRSTIQIGTTHPVDYDLYKIDEKQLRLELKGTNIRSFRQRPLITTRFNSAVDVITPLQTEQMRKTGKTFVDIHLREDVPYQVEEEDGLLLVRFEPSSIPPDPDRKVAIPTEHVVEIEQEVALAEPEKTLKEPEQVISEAPRREPEAVAVVESEEVAEESGREPEAVTVEVAAAEPERPEVEKRITPEEEADGEIVDIFGPAARKKYTGEPIALDFYKTDIRNVIRILKDVSGENFAIDRDVSGSVTLSFLKPVPWDQVLALILEMNDLGIIERDGIIRIATRDTIRRQKEAARAELAADQALKKTEEEMAPLVTEYFAISYSQAGADILPHLQDLLTDRGHVKVDSRTNQVIMTDIPEKIEKAREIIKRIDKVTPQVMISARVVETSTNFSREFGTEWGANNSPGVYRRDMGGIYNYNVAMNNPAGAATNTLGVNFSRIVGTPFSLDAKLSLMETTGEVRIISSPRVVTLNNKTASISQGQEFPYQSVEDGNVKVEFKDADLKLEVTPQVTPDNRIAMKIFIEEKEIGAASSPGQEPPLNTKEARTELLVNDGDTVVIGGIIQQTERESQSGVPYISKIPLLGHLFKQTSRSNDKTELMIFITPTVVRLE